MLTYPVLNEALDITESSITHASIHTGDPGATGAGEVAGGSYTRQLITWLDASNGTKSAVGVLTFQIPAGTTITHLGTWNAATGGTFAGGQALTAPQAFLVGAPYQVTLALTSRAGAATVLNAADYGAVGDGTVDDTVAIQAALDDAPYGGVVLLAGCHATTAPITIPPQVTLRGLHGGHIDDIHLPTLRPLASFTGSSVILMVDQATGGYAVASNEQRIECLSIDADLIPGSTVRGIRAEGFVHGVYITDVAIHNAPGNGLSVQSNGSGTPYSWHVLRLHVDAAGGFGINAGLTDSTWVDCEVIGAALNGWLISATAANSVFTGCRAEWSLQAGFAISANFGTGQGSGGIVLTGCTTDRNGEHGVAITATGNAPISLVGCTFRRDGRTSTSGGYAAVSASSATAPVLISGCTVYPGTNDDGTGNATPQYGFTFAGNTLVSYDACVIHAISSAVHDGGTNTRLLRGVNVVERTGTTASPTTTDRGLVIGESGMDFTGNALGVATPRAHSLVAWTYDPAHTASGKAGTAGTLYLSALYVSRAAALTKLLWGINTVGVSPTSTQNIVALIDPSGTVVASVNVDARVTTTGLFTETISVNVTPGVYRIAFLFNASTMPQIYRGSDLSATLSNAGITTASAYRYATNGTGLTAMPGSVTLSGNTIGQNTYFGAIG